ncbi:MAG: DUF3592 domain-containing protein [Lachnospiraceae bacterium]|nr:DUF3592 domain-containing protein [Lachnospiraceae bacterium]MCM1231186.1 DUF3592 domain-containing protein [Ruminococcus flavefaciens]
MKNFIVISAIVCVIITVIAIFGLVIFATTASRCKYRRIKNKATAVGTITRIQHISPDRIQPNLNEYYLVDYSFTDTDGISHSRNFSIGRLKNLEEGDKISVYYDSADPDKCVTDYRLKSDRNLWWQAVLITFAILCTPFLALFIKALCE